MANSKPATQTIVNQHAPVKQSLPFEDQTDFDNAKRGRTGRPTPNTVTGSNNRVVWDAESYRFWKRSVQTLRTQVCGGNRNSRH